jgi:diacylglycerol kinase (ATP)
VADDVQAVFLWAVSEKKQARSELFMKQNQSAVIIYNPLAGRGKAVRFAERSRQKLERCGWKVKALLQTEYAGHAEHVLSPKWSTDVALIVVVAGDGTLREVCAGLDPTYGKSVIAFIPMGNANVIARELNIPLDPEKAVALLTEGRPRPMDAGVLTLNTGERMLFLAMVEIGYGAKIVHLVDDFRQRWFKMLYKISGDLIYAVAGVLALSPKTNIPFSMKVDDRWAFPDIKHGVIANTEAYATGWSMTPGARSDDGVLDVITRIDCSILNTIKLLSMAIRRKRLPPPLARYCRARRIDISSEDRICIQVDGDPVPACQSFSVDVSPRHFQIIVPQG